jgi:hypothetical protein
MIVRQQNAATNNVTFEPERAIPFYVFCESLLVFWDLFDSIARSVGDTELNPVLLAGLQDASHCLKRACWGKLAQYPEACLKEIEISVQNKYSRYWTECQIIFEGLKDPCFAEHVAEMELADAVNGYLESSLGSMGSRLMFSCLISSEIQ